MRPARKKVFGDGRQTPIDRNDRARIMFLARAARKRGEITRAAVDVLEALLFTFANLKDGRCFPGYDKIAEAAGCCARTVGRCLPDLEALRFVAWVNRIKRVREQVAGLPGIGATSWRVTRTSNAYDFPLIAKQSPGKVDMGHLGRGTEKQDIFLPIEAETARPKLDRSGLSKNGNRVLIESAA
jgi:alkylated DNA nucleotide flippase Atl1